MTDMRNADPCKGSRELYTNKNMSQPSRVEPVSSPEDERGDGGSVIFFPFGLLLYVREGVIRRLGSRMVVVMRDERRTNSDTARLGIGTFFL